MKVTYRSARKEDSHRLAELDNIASGGAIDFLFHDLVPNMSPVEIVASNFREDEYPHTYRNAMVATLSNKIIGMSLSFPGKYHTITDEMIDFFPPDRLTHFQQFFSAPVGDGYFLDALCVDEEFRNKGIGGKLIELTKEKARREGYDSLFLIVFKDNVSAQGVYRKHGFSTIDLIELHSHVLMKHEGGCLLMKTSLLT